MKSYYIYRPKDPLWRRFLMRSGLLMMDLSDHLHSPGDKETWRDRIASKVYEIGDSLFVKGIDGSDEEIAMAINGETPWSYMTHLQRQACWDWYGNDLKLDSFGHVDNSFPAKEGK